MSDEEFESLVGLIGGAKAGILSHGPRTCPVHTGVNPSGEWKFPGITQIRVIVEVHKVLGPVDRLHLHSRLKDDLLYFPPVILHIGCGDHGNAPS